MNSIDVLLEATLDPIENVKLVATPRWKINGVPVVWEICALPPDTVKALRLEASRRANKALLQRTKTLKIQDGSDEEQTETLVAQNHLVQIFNELLAVECTVFPDLKNAKLQDAFGVHTEIDLLKKILSVEGEYSKYLGKALELNGYGSKEYEDTFKEAKND